MSLILLRFAFPQCLAATHLSSSEVGNGLRWSKPQCTCNAMVTSPELSTGRMDPRVGSGKVTILPEFGGSGRVSTSDFLVFY